MSARRTPRVARGVENFLDVADVGGTFRNAGAVMVDASRRARAQLVEEVAQAVVQATEDGRLISILDGWRPPAERALASHFASTLEVSYSSGRRQVSEELERQRLTRRPAAAGSSLRLAEATGESDERRRARSKARIALEGTVAASAVASAAVAAAAGAVSQAQVRASLEIAEITRQVAEVAGRSAEEAALRAAAHVYRIVNLGRADEAVANSDRIAKAVYSAYLDEATCDACGERDFDETSDLDEAATWTPNASCAGGDRCRCLTIYELA